MVDGRRVTNGTVTQRGARLHADVEHAKWRLVRTYVTDPERATVLIRVRFESLDGEDHDLEIAYDPQLYNDGSDDVGWTRGHALLAHDRNIASALVARPALTRTSSGYVGRDRAPARAHLRRAPARQRRPAGAHAPDRPRRAARHDARARLRGARAARRSTAAQASLDARLRRDRRRLREGLAATTARSCCRSRPRRCRSPPPTRRRCSCSRRTRTRTTAGAFVASPSMPGAGASSRSTRTTRARARTTSSGRATSTRSPPRCSRRATRPPPTARSTSCSSKQQLEDGSFPQNTQVDGSRSGRGCRWTRSGCRSCSPGSSAARAGRLGPRPPRRRLIVDKGPVSEQERWENQEGYSPGTIAAEIAGLICAADIARKQRRRPRARRATSARPTRGRATSSAGRRRRTARTRRRPYYLRLTKDRKPEQRHDLQHRRLRPVEARPAPGRRRQLPRAGPARRQALRRPGDPQHAAGRRPAAEGRRVLAPLQLRRLRRAPRRQAWRLFDERHAHDARPGVADLRRRARRVRAARGPPGGRAPGGDGGRGQRRRNAARAGLGRPRADRQAGLPGRRGDVLGDAAGLDPRAVRPARVVGRSGRLRSSARRSSPTAIRAAAGLSAILPCRPRAGAGFSFDPAH